MRSMKLFVIRYPVIVNIDAILERISIVNRFGDLKPIQDDIDVLAHLKTNEVRVWTTEPNALKGFIEDHNQYWPGLQIGIYEVNSK